MKVTVLRHTTSQLGPKPRVAMMGGILALEWSLAFLDTMRKGIVAVVMAEDEATSRSLWTEVVVQSLTLVGGDSSCQVQLKQKMTINGGFDGWN